MAITVRATSNGLSNNSNSTSISLPAGTTTGDVTFIAIVQANFTPATVTPSVISPPAGWTTISNAAGIGLFYRAFVAGDPTTGITFTSTRTDWFNSSAIAYTGLDTANPIDGNSSCYQMGIPTTGTSIGYYAPSLNPRFVGSQLLVFMGDARSTGAAIGLPTGLTSRVSNAVGPDILLADKLLTSTGATGSFTTALTGSSEVHAGMQVALKASGAAGVVPIAAYPVLAGQQYIAPGSSVASATVDLLQLNAKDQDVVVIFSAGAGLIATPPTGYTSRGVQGANCYTHTWSTGDPTSLTFNYSPNAVPSLTAILLRKSGVSTSGVTLDVSNTATASGSGGVAIASPSMVPSLTTDIYLSFIGLNSSSSTTWSAVTGGITVGLNEAFGPSFRFAFIETSPNPSGAFSATYTNGGVIGSAAVALLFQVVTVVPQAELNIPANVGQLYPRGGTTL